MYRCDIVALPRHQQVNNSQSVIDEESLYFSRYAIRNAIGSLSSILLGSDVAVGSNTAFSITLNSSDKYNMKTIDASRVPLSSHGLIDTNTNSISFSSTHIDIQKNTIKNKLTLFG
jgi:hypothetical protein